MAIQQDEHNPSFLLDALYCEEERWEDGEAEDDEAGEVLQEESSRSYNNGGCGSDKNASFFPVFVFEQGLFWEDEELLSLFSKEQGSQCNAEIDDAVSLARAEAVEWMLKVNAHYGFTTLTAVLAINYLDRFLSSLHFQRDKPWMIQLAAVTCISLAAKIEETQVPLLLDLQVKETKYVFHAKTIQRMELLVLSSLQWKMHPVTPLSFLDYIVRKLGLKTHLHWEFLRRCERLLLSLISDSRSVRFLPSVLATATMMHVTDQVHPFHSIDYQNQLLGVLKINKEQVNECYELILDLSKPQKRKYCEILMPSSPIGVIDAMFCGDSSNDSWALDSPPEPVFKKNRGGGGQEQGMQIMQLPPPSLNRVFADIVGSPP